jgi:excisionase family DNA binding protein
MERNMKHPSDDKLLKVGELAKYLGVAPSTVYRWLDSGKLFQPFALGDGAVRWRKSEIDQWLEERRR